MSGGSQTIRTSETRAGALNLQNSTQGLAIPIVFGTTRITPNLLDYFDFTATAHTTSQTSGGKGGGSVTTENTTYTYSVGVILGLMEGPSAAGSSFVGSVWASKDVTDPTALGLSLFEGSYSQTAWAFMVSAHPSNAESYRGTAYAATAALDLGASSSLPNFGFEVTGFGAAGDVNIADIIDPLLTDEKYGAGWPAAQLGSLADFDSYCAAAGLAAAPAYTTQRPMAEMLAELLRIGNAAPVWSEGVLKIRTYADETVGAYVPDLTVQYDLTYEDLLAGSGEPPVKIARKRQADAFNIIQLNIRDRANQYNKAVVEASDQWNIDVYGPRPMDPIDCPAICDLDIGRTVAQTILQRELYIRNTYSFTVGWRYGRLEPMDIVSLTDQLLGLDETPVRITAIEEDENGQLHMTAEDVATGTGTPGSYSTQPSSGSTPAGSVDPGDTYAPVIFQPPLALSITPQIWIGAQGGAEWGGAQVWVSVDGGASYARTGAITGAARYGVLTANMPNTADPDTTSTLAVNLTASRGTLTAADSTAADALATMCYVDGEIVAYSAATLTSAYNYSLDTYMRRGQAGSTSGAHLTGTQFMRLDEAVAKFPISAALYGETIYLKLLSYNRTGGGLQALADVSATTFTPVAQAATGAGFSWVADRTTTTVGDPGPGKMRWNNAAQASATTVVFDAQTNDGANMVAYFSAVGSAGYLELRDYTDSSKWASYTLTSATAPAGYQTFGVTYQAGGAEIPNGDTVLATFSPTPPTGVTSVALSLPGALFSVSGSPVTTTGTLTGSLIAQVANTVLAGPTSGANAAPTMRSIVAADMNASGANGSTVLHGDMTWRVLTAGNVSGSTYVVGASWSGGGSTITASSADKVARHIPVTGNISKYVVVGESAAGSCVIDIWRDAYANYPPTVADTITAAAKPTIAAGRTAQSTTLTGWSKAVTAGDILMFKLDSSSTFEAISIFLEITP